MLLLLLYHQAVDSTLLLLTASPSSSSSSLLENNINNRTTEKPHHQDIATTVHYNNNNNNINNQTSISTTTDNIDLQQLLLVGLLISLILISIVGNCLVCVAIFTDRRLRKLGNAFIVSLAIADLFVSCLVMTFALCNDLMNQWIFGDWFCDVWISFDIMCCTASILNLCAISLDRFIHIKDCLLYNQWMTRRIAISAVIVIWFISALVSFVPINLGWHKPPTGHSNLSLNLNLNLMPDPDPNSNYHHQKQHHHHHQEFPITSTKSSYSSSSSSYLATDMPPFSYRQSLHFNSSNNKLFKNNQDSLTSHHAEAEAETNADADQEQDQERYQERDQEHQDENQNQNQIRKKKTTEKKDSNLMMEQDQSSFPPQCMLTLTPTYAIISSTISFYIPCIIMLGLYTKLFACARKHVKNIQAITKAPAPLPAIMPANVATAAQSDCVINNNNNNNTNSELSSLAIGHQQQHQQEQQLTTKESSSVQEAAAAGKQQQPMMMARCSSKKRRLRARLCGPASVWIRQFQPSGVRKGRTVVREQTNDSIDGLKVLDNNNNNSTEHHQHQQQNQTAQTINDKLLLRSATNQLTKAASKVARGTTCRWPMASTKRNKQQQEQQQQQLSGAGHPISVASGGGGSGTSDIAIENRSLLEQQQKQQQQEQEQLEEENQLTQQLTLDQIEPPQGANSIISSGELFLQETKQEEQEEQCRPFLATSSYEQQQHTTRSDQGYRLQQEALAVVNRACSGLKRSESWRQSSVNRTTTNNNSNLKREQLRATASSNLAMVANQQQQQQRGQQLATHKAAVTLGIIMGTFLFCWVPFFCLNIIKAFCDDCIPSSLFRAFTWLGYANSALNPIIYGIHNSEFRNAFNRIFFKHLNIKNSRYYQNRRFSSYDMRYNNNNNNNHHHHQPHNYQQQRQRQLQLQQQQQHNNSNHFNNHNQSSLTAIGQLSQVAATAIATTAAAAATATATATATTASEQSAGSLLLLATIPTANNNSNNNNNGTTTTQNSKSVSSTSTPKPKSNSTSNSKSSSSSSSTSNSNNDNKSDTVT